MGALSKSYEEIMEEINAIHAAKHRKSHPLYQAIWEGTLSKKQIQEYLKQSSVIPLYNHLFHGPLYVICPDPVWRRRMAEVTYEEGTGALYSDGVAHYELFLRLGEAFGISREEMYGTKLLAASISVRNFYESVCQRSFIEGFAAMALGGEAQVPGSAGKVSESFMKNYGMTAEQVAFHTVHEVADSDHSAGGLEFLQDFAKTDAEAKLIVNAVYEAVEVMWQHYDAIWSHLKTVN